MEEHKSVIMHLLSQVRLGMDLTKVRMKFGVAVSPNVYVWVLTDCMVRVPTNVV